MIISEANQEMQIVINVNHYMSVCHGQIIQSSYSWYICVDAALFWFEVIPFLIFAEARAFVLGIKPQLSRARLFDIRRSFYG